MATPIRFLESPRPDYGRALVESPLVRKVMARNPGPFTYWGTGTYIIGRGEVAVIDPGPAIPAHIEAIRTALSGESISHILVTHSHLDHSPAARPLAEATGAPVLAFGPHGSGRAAGLEDQVVEAGADSAFAPDVLLADAEQVSGPDWTLEAIHTPGHTSNHLCFALREDNTVFSGDHVMGWSTTVISPPDGDMALYMKSLKAIRAREFKTIRPTHGPAIEDTELFLKAIIDHRLKREQEILAALAGGVDTIANIVPVIYPGLAKELFPAAALSVLAHLIWLVDKGQVKADPEPLLDARFGLQ